MMDETWLAPSRQSLETLPYDPLFVTVSGAHLYGFASPDSDIDLRGTYVLPLESVLGLDKPQETLTSSFEQASREIDLVLHDVKKFIVLLLNKNGYVLEQLYSPLVVQGGPAFKELRTLGRGCITRQVYHHYNGFCRHQVERFESESPPRVKTLLYVYRVLLTGIHVLETGQVEANLLRLNEVFRLPFIPDLIAQKKQEKALLVEPDLARHQTAIARLQARLETAFQESSLPEAPRTRPALNNFLVRVRLGARHD
jgi:predicted nucleotidyltransferase